MIAGVAEDVKRVPARALGLDSGKTTGWGVVEIFRPAPPNRFGPMFSLMERVVAYGVLDQENPVVHLRELLLDHHPDLVGVEVIKEIHPVKRHGINGISTDHALSLYNTGRVTERLIGVVRGAEIPVVEHTVEQVRKELAGARNANDKEVDLALRLRLADFPAPRRSNNHNRDGIAVALFALLDARLRAARVS